MKAHHDAEHLVMPWGMKLMQPRVLKVLRDFPSFPRWVRAVHNSPATAWSSFDPASVPAELRTVPGVRRDPEREEAAFAEAPLRSFFHVHADTMSWVGPRLWRAWVPVAPRLLRARRTLRLTAKNAPVEPATVESPVALTSALKAEAARLGLSAVGVAAYDPKYTFAEFAGKQPGERVIVCIQEQNYRSTQLLPTSIAEQTALSTYAELMDRMAELCRWLQERGYRAKGDDQEGESIFIHYGVAAGLGQLGLNGQLLTPQAGSRCRISVIYTDAPLELDEPVDYGLEAICDECQVCVRRCPVGAIPRDRSEHRGIYKAKLNTKRCFPIVAQAAGCAICMKTCPVQAYGLEAVASHYRETGEILGKGTDDLEGFDWPFDGRHYGPGEKPRVPAALQNPPDMPFDLLPKRRSSGGPELEGVSL